MKTIFSFFAAALAAFALFVTSGCETEAISDTQLTISPSTATIKKGQSVTLTAQGGSNYKWGYGDSGKLGTLSSLNGDSVTFTATSSNGTQIITVNAFSNANIAASAIINVK